MTILGRVRTEFRIAFVAGNLFKKPPMCLSVFLTKRILIIKSQKDFLKNQENCFYFFVIFWRLIAFHSKLTK